MARYDIAQRWEGYSKRPLVEGCVKVDLWSFRPWANLITEKSIHGFWKIRSRLTEREIHFWMNAESLRIRGPLGRPGLVENHTLRLIRVPDKTARMRWWFQCPGCSRSVRILYSLGHGHFWEGRGFPLACRTCHRLTYASAQTESGQARQARQREICRGLQGFRMRCGSIG